MDLHQKVCPVIKLEFHRVVQAQERGWANFLCSLFMWTCGGWGYCLSHTQITLPDKRSSLEESWGCNFITLALTLL